MRPHTHLRAHLRHLTTSAAAAAAPAPAPPRAVYTPPASSLARRASIAERISALKWPRPRTPFYKLAAAHRRPTLWTLYRGLRRLAPSGAVRLRVRRFFERWRSLTSPTITREKLLTAHRWLETFRKVHAGDEKAVKIVERYARLVAVKFEKAKMDRLIRDEIHWRHRLANRPILTGGYMRPTISNGPLPRMKPQPIHVTGMILSRIRTRVRRIDRQAEIANAKEDLRLEGEFEDALLRLSNRPGGGTEREGEQAVFGGAAQREWMHGFAGEEAQIQSGFERDVARKLKPFPPSMLAQIRAAKAERIRNKRHELEREKRGGSTLSMRVRARKSYPTGVMDRWDAKKRREMIYVRRTVSEVGWAGELKRKMGWNVGPSEDERVGSAKEDIEARERAVLEADEERARRIEAEIGKGPAAR